MELFEKPYKILVIDDDEGDYFLIKNYLAEFGQEYYHVDWASSYAEGLRGLEEGEHHVYLVDQLLGAGTGLELIINATQNGNKFPKIVLTGTGNRQLDIKAIEAGADDYLSKEWLNTEILDRTIRHALERYEQKIATEEQYMRFKSLFEQSIDAIYITDEKWEIQQANGSFLKLFEYTQNEVAAMHMQNIFRDAETFATFVNRNLVHGHVKSFNAELIKSSNDVVIALVSSSPILNFDKQITGYQGIIHDVTKLKKAEYELMIADQYSLTNRMARMIAHEVRNPLTNITLALTQIEDVSEDDMLYIDMMRRNSDRINNLINDLLTSTKMAKPELTDTIMEDVIKSAIENCSDRIKLKEVDLRMSGLEHKTLVKADAEKLAMAITNILTNAIEATDDVEEPVIVVTCSAGKKYCIIEITDNGNGMDDETRDNLFKAFYSKRKGGMGLGLTTVQNIVLQHNGEITVKTFPNSGTSFTIFIPIA